MSEQSKFWAGGSKPGWFVKLSRPQEVYPGSKPADVMVRWFNSGDYANGELGAARDADRLAERLNAALAALAPAPAPAPAPAARRVTYFVSATYATPSGRMAHWSGRMASASGDILADAERLIRKYRKVAGKLDIRAAAI